MKPTLTATVLRQARLFSLLILLLTTSLSPVLAGDPAPRPKAANAATESLRNTLIAALPFPGEIATGTASNQVQLSFMITEDRKLDVIRVEGSNLALNRYVLDQLDGISMNRFSAFAGKMIKIQLSFAPKA